MRSTLRALGICLGSLMCGLAHGQTASPTIEPTTPRVYALVAAIGDQFTTVTAVQTVGSHLSPYRRSTSDVPNNVLNRFALHSLDKAIEAVEPTSTRIYLSVPAASMNNVAASEREGVAIATVAAALQKMPQRLKWDRIVVVTPAYRALDRDGMPSKLQGFGIFSEPRCQTGCDPRSNAGLDPEPQGGWGAVTSEDGQIKARTFVAPFSYITVWVLDSKTLAVLDKQQSFDHQKLAEPTHKPALDPSKDEVQKYLAMRIANVIVSSVAAAVTQSEVLTQGHVEVGPIKEVDPGDVKKK